jgi:hypothetical protein
VDGRLQQKMQSQVGARYNPMAAGISRPPPAPASKAMTMPPPPQTAQQPFQGTLAPGTRLMIGQIVVTVQGELAREVADLPSKDDQMLIRLSQVALHMSTW